MNQKDYKRRQYIIEPDFQYGLIRKVAVLAVIILVMSLSSLSIAYYLYADVEVIISQPLPFSLSGNEVEAIEQESTVFSLLWPVLLISVTATLAVIFIFGCFLSHKMAGPVFRMRVELVQMKQGNLVGPVRIRKGDAFQSLADEISNLKKKWLVSIQEMQSTCNGIEVCDEAARKARLKRLAEILSLFKTV